MTDAPPQLSAIVIAYDGMAYLPDCLRTLADDLRGINHEIIVVDNGSTDGSAEYVRDAFPSVRLIANGANLGFTRAINIGLRAARGGFVYLLNQDLRFRPGGTARLLDRLQRDQSIGLIGPAFPDFGGRLQPSARAFPRYRHVVYDLLLLGRLFPRHREFSGWRMGWFDHRSEMFVEQPMGAAMLLPTSVIEQVGEFDERFPIFFSDVDYCKRLELAGFRRLYCPQAEVEHAVGTATGRRPYASRVRSHVSMYRYFRKYTHWYGLPALWLCGLLLMLGLIPSLLAIAVSSRKHD